MFLVSESIEVSIEKENMLLRVKLLSLGFFLIKSMCAITNVYNFDELSNKTEIKYTSA
jgi:hypothetical protein